MNSPILKRSSLFFFSFTGGTFEGNTDIKTVSTSPQVVIKEAVLGHTNNLTFGFDYVDAEEEIFNVSVFFGFPTIGEFDLEKKNYGFYVHDEFFLLETLALSAGYRYDKVEYAFSPALIKDLAEEIKQEDLQDE